MVRGWALAAAALAAGALVVAAAIGEPEEPEEPSAVVVRTIEDRAPPSLRGSGGGDRHAPAVAAEGSIVGRVTRMGRGIPARVEIRSVGPAHGARSWSEVRSRIGRLLVVGDLESPAYRTAESDPDGVFSFAGVPLGLYECSARPSGLPPAFADAAILAAGRTAKVELAVPAGPVSVSGIATWKDGRPFRGWIVVQSGGPWNMGVEYGDPRGAVVAPTDAAGRFLAEGLPPGDAVLSALLPHRWRVAAYQVRLPYGGEYRFTVDADMEEVRGRVVADESGKPVAGAVVHGNTYLPNTIDYAFFRAVADEGGRFSLFAEPAGIELEVAAPGFAPRRVVVAKAEGEFVIRLHRPAVITGRVTAAAGGGAVAGAVVRAHIAGCEPLAAVSGPDGAYRLDGIPPGLGAIFVLGGGWASEEIPRLSEENALDPFEILVGPAERRTIDFRVVKSGVARLRVLDSSGRPLPAEATVTAHGDRWPPGSPTASDEEGRIVVSDLPPEVEFSAWVRATGAASASASGRVDGPEVEVRLAPTREIEVEVRGEGGAPLAAATVEVVSEESAGPARWWTDAEGLARATGVPLGPVTVRAFARDHLPGSLEDFGGAAGEDQVPRATIRLEPARSISGRVVVPEGVPPEAIMLSANPEAWESIESRVGDDGSFRFDGLPAGKVNLSASVYIGERSWNGSLDVEAGTEGVVLPLEEDAEEESKGWIKVRVLLPDGTPVPAASLRVFRVEDDGRMSRRGNNAVTDGEGMAWVGDEAENSVHWIEVSEARDEYGRSLGLAPVSAGPLRYGDPEPTLRLEPGLSIEGRARGPDGEPLAGLRVEASAQGDLLVGHTMQNASNRGTHAVARTDASGAFRLGGLLRGVYRLDFRAPAGLVAPPSPLADAGDRSVEIRFRRARRALLTLLDAADQPVVGATVAAWTRQGAEDWRLVEQRSTGMDGSARFHYLDPMLEHHLLFSCPWNRDDLPSAHLFPMPAGDATIRLARMGAVEGTVIDAGGARVEGAQVWWRTDPAPGNSWTHAGQTGPDGRFDIQRIPDAAVEVYASIGGGETLRQSPPVRARGGGAAVLLTLP